MTPGRNEAEKLGKQKPGTKEQVVFQVENAAGQRHTGVKDSRGLQEVGSGEPKVKCKRMPILEDFVCLPRDF